MKTRSAMRVIAPLLIALGALLAATVAGGEGGGRNQFPCTSTTIRAGALLPELLPDRQLLTDDHVVWRDPQTGQFLLAFSAGIENLGAGPMNAVGYRDSVAGDVPNPNTMPAYQRVFHADGSCDEVQIGTLTYHDVHHPVKPNTKIAFCLADIVRVAPALAGSPKAPAFNGCDPNRQSTYVNMGTSVGWEDIYDKMLFGQNFDVTALMSRPQAQYFIRQTVDAAGIIHEQNDANNSTGIWVTLGVGVPYSTGGPRPGV
jgi:hypothetical protein